MSQIRLIVFSVSLVALCCCIGTVGCGKGGSGDKRTENAGNSISNRTEVAAQGGDTNSVFKTIDLLSPDDVIVSVNGAELTKKAFEENVGRTLKRMAQQPRMSKQQMTSIARRYVRTYIPTYVDTQILLQEARRSNVLGTDALSRGVEAWLAKQAKAEGKPLDQFLKTVPGGAVALTNDAEMTVLVSALLETNVMGKAVVSDEFVAQTMAAIQDANRAIEATNALKIARLNLLREQIAGGADFGRLADINSECQRSAPGNNGYWGEFARRDFADKKMQDAIFKLKPGEISEVLSDEEGFHIVKMLTSKNNDNSGAGAASAPQTVSLAHILLQREPEAETTLASDLKNQLIRQKKGQLIEEYVGGLRAKSVIVYPHGTNFWPKATPGSAPRMATVPGVKK